MCELLSSLEATGFGVFLFVLCVVLAFVSYMSFWGLVFVSVLFLPLAFMEILNSCGARAASLGTALGTFRLGWEYHRATGLNLPCRYGNFPSSSTVACPLSFPHPGHVQLFPGEGKLLFLHWQRRLGGFSEQLDLMGLFAGSVVVTIG